MTYEIGPYNVTFAGPAYSKGRTYEMVIIEKFEGETYIQGSRKVLYFRNEKPFVVPNLLTVTEIEEFLKYQEFSRLEVEVVMQINVENRKEKKRLTI